MKVDSSWYIPCQMAPKSSIFRPESTMAIGTSLQSGKRKTQSTRPTTPSGRPTFTAQYIEVHCALERLFFKGLKLQSTIGYRRGLGSFKADRATKVFIVVMGSELSRISIPTKIHWGKLLSHRRKIYFLCWDMTIWLTNSANLWPFMLRQQIYGLLCKD